MPERLALYTTIYPAAIPYIRSWFESVRSQTDKGFDLCIGLDSLTSETISEILGAEPNEINYFSCGQGTPAQIRGNALGRLISDYDAVIFADSDDVLYPTRVETARKGLRSFDVTACALSIIDRSGAALGITFGDLADEGIYSLLPRYNVFGLSNTAYRSDVLSRCLPLDADCELFDWSLVTRAWADGARLDFQSEPQMAYRQYESNVAKVLPPFSAEQVRTATKRVRGHYRCLLESDRPVNGEIGTCLQREYERVEQFWVAISKENDLLDEYVQALNEKNPRYVWWWCVAHPELQYLWKN